MFDFMVFSFLLNPPRRLLDLDLTDQSSQNGDFSLIVDIGEIKVLYKHFYKCLRPLINNYKQTVYIHINCKTSF